MLWKSSKLYSEKSQNIVVKSFMKNCPEMRKVRLMILKVIKKFVFSSSF